MSDARFFITVIPGLESVAHLELCEKWQQSSAFLYPEVKYFKGGLEVDLPFEQGCNLNHLMRTSTRILYRAREFESPDIATFKKEIQKVKWDDFFKSKETLKIVFTSRSSKLSMSGQIEDVFKKELGFKIGSSNKKVFVRLFRDQCVISIDTTGERAQFRGQNKKVGKAPLRDSTAAALLRILSQGLTNKPQLIDPMMGSGTFLIEALAMNQPVKRDFSFHQFIKKVEVAETPSEISVFSKVYGFDRDEKMLETAKHNFSQFTSKQFQLTKQDLFSEELFESKNPNRCVIINPPWGRRMKKSDETVAQWFEAIDRKFSPQRIGLLIPVPFTIPDLPWEKVRDVYFENSGLLNRFIVFVKP